MASEIRKQYHKSLIESYRDFSWVYDSNLGCYVILLDDEMIKDSVFVNITDENKKDSIEDVLDYVDDYFDNLQEQNQDLNTEEEDLTESVLLDEDIDDSISFYIKAINLNNNEETIEFVSISDAQDFIDSMKVGQLKDYLSAILYDSNNNELDAFGGVRTDDT